MIARPVGIWAAIVVVLTAAACATKQATGRTDSAQSLIVLLPDPETGGTGAASVANAFGAVELEAPRDAALVTSNQGPVALKLTEEEVEKRFGDALAALPPPVQRFTLFFRFESDELTEQSAALISTILAAVRKHTVQDVVVTGHTDTMGAQPTNYALGLKRALMVRNLLVKAGLDSSTIDVTSFGELDPLVPTPDETPEPRNRRVEITVR